MSVKTSHYADDSQSHLLYTSTFPGTQIFVEVKNGILEDQLMVSPIPCSHQRNAIQALFSIP